MEMQTRSLVVVEKGDAQIDIRDAAAGVTQVRPSASLGGGAVASGSSAPSDASEADKRLSFCDFRSQLCKADRWHDFRCLYFQECKIDVFIPANQSGSVRDRFAVFKDFDFNYGIV